jgi:hypothetical protein
MFLRNVGHFPNCMALQSRRPVNIFSDYQPRQFVKNDVSGTISFRIMGNWYLRTLSRPHPSCNLRRWKHNWLRTPALEYLILKSDPKSFPYNICKRPVNPTGCNVSGEGMWALPLYSWYCLSDNINGYTEANVNKINNHVLRGPRTRILT